MSNENVYAPPSSDLGTPSEESRLATRWSRLWGALIDGIIAIAVIIPAMFLTGYWEKAMAQTVTNTETIIFGVFGLILFLALHGYLLAVHGQTIGKRLVGTRIVSAETEEILPFGKILLLRILPISIATQIPLIGQFLAIIDSLFVFRKDKRCVHDLLAGTIVVRANAL